MNTHAVSHTHSPGSIPNCEAAVERLAVDCGKLPARAEFARFQGNGGVTECHVTVQLTGPASDPVETLESAWSLALAAADIDVSTTVFRRFFASDVANQAKRLLSRAHLVPGAVSLIGQPPLPAAKLALWSQHLADPAGRLKLSGNASHCQLRRGQLTHHWITGLAAPSAADSASQTRAILAKHGKLLADHDMALADHVVRTWWFARDIDNDYQGLVDVRREHFRHHGLGQHSHYIASTGIAGAPAAPAARLALDSHAIAGLRPEQIEFIEAPDHLCPTHAYGVTFERATAITYADRRHVYLSGTASIDAHGRIVHEGDVLKQLDRTLENSEALLAKAGANIGDLALVLVYLRDPADAAAIEPALRERLGHASFVLLHAPVCRPGWLIEIEGLAIVPADRPELPKL